MNLNVLENKDFEKNTMNNTNCKLEKFPKKIR